MKELIMFSFIKLLEQTHSWMMTWYFKFGGILVKQKHVSQIALVGNN